MYIKNASTTVTRFFLLPYTVSLTGPPLHKFARPLYYYSQEIKHTAFAWLQLRKIQTDFRVTGHLVQELKREETNTHAAW